jgi:hypothetical protein
VTVAGGKNQQQVDFGRDEVPAPILKPVSLLPSERVSYLPIKHRQQDRTGANIALRRLNHAGEGQTTPGYKDPSVAHYGARTGHCVTRELYPYKPLMVRWAESDTESCHHHRTSRQAGLRQGNSEWGYSVLLHTRPKTVRFKAMSKRRDYYEAYIQSAHWKRLRRQAFERDGFKCALCESTDRIQGHHLRYRQELDKSTVDEIQTLCFKCHDAYHMLQDMERKRIRKDGHQMRVVELIGRFQAEVED